LGPGRLKLPKFAEMVLALSKAAATDRATADEALRKTGIGESFVAGELVAETFSTPVAEIEELTAPVAELGETSVTSLLSTGPIQTIRVPQVTIANAVANDFAHTLGYAPWFFQVQASADGGATWVIINSSTDYVINVNSTRVRVTNNTGSAKIVRVAILG
jgi:hypothetical protein